MVFQHATLVFSTPGIIFGTPDPKSGPRLGWEHLFSKKGGSGMLGKHDFVEELVPHEV